MDLKKGKTYDEFYGLRKSKNIKNKLSVAHTGKKLSNNTKNKISNTLKGKYTKNNCPSWKGGRNKTKHGYINIHMPSHPRANCDGYIFEHILIMEQYLERYLKYDIEDKYNNEIVHHINGIRDDNKINNLQLMRDQEHKSLHTSRRMKIYKNKHYDIVNYENVIITDNQHIKTKYLDSLDWEYIYKEYNNGLSTLQLGKKYKISPATMRIRFKKLGYKLRKPNCVFYNKRKSHMLKKESNK